MAFNFGCSQPVFAAKNSEAVALMPMPQQVKMTPGSYQLNEQINIELKGFSEARANFHRNRLQTYFSRISQKRVALQDVSDITVNQNASANIRVIVSQAETSSTHVQFGVDESYQLTVNEEGITVTANTVFGAQYGLTTLTQLAYANSQQPLSVPYTEVQDSPRFKWRGLLIDSVRHFISLETIKRQLDGMAAAKLNVFHWHLTDDQGWRIESKRYPKLTEKASDGLFYTQAEVKDVIAYANLLGIRVVPEFGMPGHASAIAVAYPEFMAQQKQYQMERHWGVFKPLLDISSPKAYEFAENLISEMTAIFPDKYFHIGGDEVEPQHWLENENIKNLMVQQGLKDGHDLQNYFNQKIQPIIAKHDRIMVGWDEIFHPQLPDNILVQSWRGHDSLNQVANAGYKGVLSTGFYIDQPQYSDYHYRPIKGQ
jgi:hexosaminidase